jgi:hypothetical protein
MADADQVKAATQTYIYGYPLVYNLDEITKYPQGPDNLLGQVVPYNTFGSARALLDPTAKFVTPNNDTLYTIAACDLGEGPLALHVPDTADRYYVLQFVDAWTNNFAYVGRRATGTAEGDFLLAAKGYDGPVPDGARVIIAPTDLVVIVGRLQVDGDADLPTVHALQDQFTLRPLSPAAQAAGVPTPDPGAVAELAWWEKFRVALAAYPPPAADTPFLEAAAALGLTETTSPYVSPDPALVEVLVEGQRQGEAMVADLAKTAMKIVGGWSSAMHAFDYNLDNFEIGTIDAPEWKIADRTIAYVTRAAAARAGLWGNHGYEARYDLLWQDEHGDDLDGSHSYELTLAPPPDVAAFWSLTMYDEPDYYLVANPIDRYEIGDRTEGLVVGSDGAVTIRMQVDAPNADEQVNWLPAPKGAFRPVLRSYQPLGSTLDGTDALPKVRRLA